MVIVLSVSVGPGRTSREAQWSLIVVSVTTGHNILSKTLFSIEETTVGRHGSFLQREKE
jgi:hypothetical protein